MRIVACGLSLFVISCSSIVGNDGPPGPEGPPGKDGVCICAPQLHERVVVLDAASDLQVNETDVAVEKIPASDWAPGSRIAALWIDQVTVQQMGLLSSQLTMDVGTTDEPAAFAKSVPLSTPMPTVKGNEGPGLWPSGATPLTGPLVVRVYSDNLPLVGAAGRIDLHVVVATPSKF